MQAPYAIEDTSGIYSPALIFYKDLIRSNIARIIEMVGSPDRLRPHVKTHKTREVALMELEAGITRQKCATIAEAEMLASCAIPDVLLAYPMIGPNCGRLARLMKAYPQCRFSTLADHPRGVEALSAAMSEAGQTIDVFLDVDVGQHRTGILPGPEAVALYEQIARSPGLRPGGLHIYDGHNHQAGLEDRKQAVLEQLKPALALCETLLTKKLPVPHLTLGGTPTFPVYAELDLPGMECSPGTCVLHDHGYGSRFTDLTGFTAAALLLTRVISRPTPTRVTFDLGYKAVASDPPAGKRLILLDVAEYEAVLQNEEHLVIETPAAERFAPGDEVLAIPTHICPTVALHQQAYVIENGRLSDTWQIASRDRMLTF